MLKPIWLSYKKCIFIFT